MIVGFAYADKPRERILADAFGEGLDKEEYVQFQNQEEIPDVDVCCMVGVKSKDIFYECIRRGITPIMFDKGYVRHAGKGPLKLWEYWRVSVGSHQPTDYVARAVHSSDRLDRLGLKVKPWRQRGKSILIAGSSAKYHDFYKLREPTTWSGKLVTDLKKHTDKRIVYRPKPSWREAVAIPGTRYSSNGHSLEEALSSCFAMVTHGSNACFEAMLAGIPTIVLGNAVMKPISSTDITEINEPLLAEEDKRMQLLANLAYCQWTMSEFSSGEAWEWIRGQVYAN